MGYILTAVFLAGFGVFLYRRYRNRSKPSGSLGGGGGKRPTQPY